MIDKSNGAQILFQGDNLLTYTELDDRDQGK